ncbi:MAG TPA: nucleoside-diphosphate sugar epimerase/dehydratase [Candidatus Sulfotelmatobacter sp.]|nr:nucleoside-diphosphate sugar epimerase/dehydratase [Candidatus Sulfotelmatobacter sp.]
MALEIGADVFRNGSRPARGGKGMRTIIIGAGEAGRTLARDLRRTPEYGLSPVGFLDDSPAKNSAAGLPVLGRTSELESIAATHAIDVAIVAIPSLKPQEVRRFAESASAAGVSVRYLPSFGAALERDARISDLRRLRVDRLLGREELHVVRTASRSVVEGKRVLVTGAGGSIGSELCRQIKGFRPAALYMLDHDESNLHRLQMQLDGQALLDTDELLIADIRDGDRIRQLCEDLHFDVIFHAAAHKHLPLLERHPCEGIKSNVLGTRHLVEAAAASGVERFILISTDKAADPISILGASKRVAEMIVQSRAGGFTRFASVRFGNVLGSRGSFLSVLSEQIENGEAVTVTHPDVTRFFMTVEEAVGLVIEAASMAELGETFVLDMGEPVRIVDLVHNYAAQFHLREGDFEITYTGLRGGEKLNEALFSESEERLRTDHPRIWATRPEPPAGDLDAALSRLIEAASLNRSDLVREHLADLLPAFAKPMPPRAPALAAPYPDGF